MNRFLIAPGVLSMACFACVYFANLTESSATVRSSESVATTLSIKATVAKEGAMMTDEQIRDRLMDGWPTRNRYELGSRAMPTQPLYADLHEFAETGQDKSGYLTSLYVHARPKLDRKQLEKVLTQKNSSRQLIANDSFPIHINRYTGEAMVFAKRSWQPYDEWQKTALPEFEKLTGYSINR